MTDPKFSLVLATLGRSSEVLRFLESLQRQTYQSYQLIIVDQNLDDRIDQQLAKVTLRGEVLHMRSAKGLSLARNVGLTAANGSLIAFPDDDCWYPDGLLAQVRDTLDRHGESTAGLTGRSIDETGAESTGDFARDPGPLSELDVWSKAISYTIFLRSEVCRSVGPFDEQLGVGAGSVYGSGEETDYLIRALRHGYRLSYNPELCVYHPNKDMVPNRDSWKKAYSYGAGMGRVLAKHHYPWNFKVKAVARPVIGSLMAACQLDLGLARLRWSRARGRLFGLLPAA